MHFTKLIVALFCLKNNNIHTYFFIAELVVSGDVVLHYIEFSF